MIRVERVRNMRRKIYDNMLKWKARNGESALSDGRRIETDGTLKNI